MGLWGGGDFTVLNRDLYKALSKHGYISAY